MFDYEFPQYGQLDLFNEREQPKEEQGRFMVGYMRRGCSFGYVYKNTLHSANVEFNALPGDRIVGFIFDRKHCSFPTVMWENEAVEAEWFEAEYRSFHDQCSSLLVQPNLSNVFPNIAGALPKLTASNGPLDLSDPIQRGIYDGFIPRKAVAR